MKQPLLPLLFFLLFCCGLLFQIASVVCITLPGDFDEILEVQAGGSTEFEFIVNAQEKFIFQIIGAQDTFSFTLKRVSPLPDATTLPLPKTILMFDLQVNKQPTPIYNVAMEYRYSQVLTVKNLEVEDESLSWWCMGGSNSWGKFKQASYLDSTVGITTQGTSSVTDLRYFTTRIALLGASRRTVIYGGYMDVSQTESRIYTVLDQSETNYLKLNIQGLDTDSRVKIEEMKSIKQGSIFPQGIYKLLPANAAGFQFTANNNVELQAQMTYYAAKAQTDVRVDEIISSGDKVVGIQYDETAGAYFVIPTTRDGLVFKIYPQFTGKQRTTSLFLAQMTKNSNTPAVPGREVYISRGISNSIAFYSGSDSPDSPLVMKIAGSETDFTFTVKSMSGTNPYPQMSFPSSRPYVPLLFFQLSMPDTTNFQLSFTYDHAFNHFLKQGIDKSTMTLMRYSGSEWVEVGQTKISGSSFTTEASSSSVSNRDTWMAVVAAQGEFNGIDNAGNGLGSFTRNKLAWMTAGTIILIAFIGKRW